MHQLEGNEENSQLHQQNSQNKTEAEIMEFHDVFINADAESSLKEGASNVVLRLRPDWGPKACFRYKIFSDGITNKLVGVYVEGKHGLVKNMN